ncbi:MAG: FAD-dependent oxidoreductase [Candidatus Obscuribacterales bacterium]
MKVLDIQALDPGDPLSSAVREFETGKPDGVVKCDILIVGGGMGGVAAALSAVADYFRESSGGRRPSKLSICMTEETNWLGGQMTSQAVSALDENWLVESSGAPASYQEIRRQIREYYLERFIINKNARIDKKTFNPGTCWVTRLAFEPKVGLAILDRLLKPAVDSGCLKIFHRHKAVSAAGKKSPDGRVRVKSVSAIDLDNGELTEFRPKICLDATELGDMLPLCKLAYSSGEESREQTGEPHAAEIPDPENVQDIVYPFVVEWRAGEDHTIEKPEGYDEFVEANQYSLLGYRMFVSSLEHRDDGTTRELLPFWTYRRLIDRNNFEDLNYANDLAMINWESNDVRDVNIIDKSPEQMAENLARAKNVSLGFLYWLQTEAPRDEGGKGYPEMKLRPDILQSDDGLAKHPYIRESRRIKALNVVKEQDIGKAHVSGVRARPFKDSLGIGHYPIDIHGRQVPGAAQATAPFQLPYSCLIPLDAENLLPACKNIGVTHITNGAYRLHPIEWSIGTAAGLIARYSIRHNLQPGKISKNLGNLIDIQRELAEAGNPLCWFDDVPTDHPSFAAIQIVSLFDLIPPDEDSLSFRPEDPLSRRQAAQILDRLIKDRKPKSSFIADIDEDAPEYDYVARVVNAGLMELDDMGNFNPEDLFSQGDFAICARSKTFRLPRHQSVFLDSLDDEHREENGHDYLEISRAEFAQWLYTVVSYKKKWDDLALRSVVRSAI